MTPQEQHLLEDFLDKLVAVRGTVKDAQADALIANRLAQQRDADYLLVQRALLLEQALNQAKAEIARLQQGQSANAGGNFLGGNTAWSTPTAANPPPPPPAHALTWRERWFGAAPTAPAPTSSFLGSAMSTAAGVAGGMFLFNGIENLLHPHGFGSGYANGLGGLAEIVENTTIVNNYDAPSAQDQSLDVFSNSDADFDSGSDIFDSNGFGDSDSWV